MLIGHRAQKIARQTEAARPGGLRTERLELRGRDDPFRLSQRLRRTIE